MPTIPVSDLLPSSSGGTTPKIQIFTADGTWTRPDGVDTVFVQGIGGGGGGGGAHAFTTGFTSCAAGGGGAGEFVNWRPVSVTGSVAVTIGAGGLGGTGGTSTSDATVAPAAAGANGGNTTFGALLTLRGGQGGWGRDPGASRAPATTDCGSLGGQPGFLNSGFVADGKYGGGLVLPFVNTDVEVYVPESDAYRWFGLTSGWLSQGVEEYGWPGAGGGDTLRQIGHGGRGGQVSAAGVEAGGNADAGGYGCGGGGAVAHRVTNTSADGGDGTAGKLVVMWWE